jgi:hypothetical protein
LKIAALRLELLSWCSLLGKRVALLVEAQKIWESIACLGLACSDKLIRAVLYQFRLSRGITSASSIGERMIFEIGKVQ